MSEVKAPPKGRAFVKYSATTEAGQQALPTEPAEVIPVLEQAPKVLNGFKG